MFIIHHVFAMVQMMVKSFEIELPQYHTNIFEMSLPKLFCLPVFLSPISPGVTPPQPL